MIKEKNHGNLENQYSKSSIDLRKSSSIKDMGTQTQKQTQMSLVFVHEDNLSELSIPTPKLLPLSNVQFTTEKQEDDNILDKKPRDPQQIPQNINADQIQNEPIPDEQQINNNEPDPIEEEMNNSLNTSKTMLQWRISSLNMLLSLLRQKLTLKKIWLLFHYFPLCVAFLVIAIHQAASICTYSISIHLIIYAVLSMRNFIFNLILKKRITRHIQVLEFYIEKPLAHISFRNSLNDLQHTYKNLEKFKEERQKKEDKARQNEGNRLEGLNEDTQNQELLQQTNINVVNSIQQNLPQEGVNSEQQSAYLNNDIKENNKQDNHNNIDVVQVQVELEDHTQQSNQQIQEIFDLPLPILYSNEVVMEKLLKAPRIMDRQRQYEQWRHQSLISKRLKPKDLLKSDFLLDTYQQLQKMPNENAAASYLESTLKYGDDTLFVRLLRVYTFLEEGYMLIYCLMQLTITFCSPSVGKAAIFFGFYYSVVKILHLTVIALTLSFFAISLVFYFFFKIIQLLKHKTLIKTISFKKAKVLLLKNSKITELEKDTVACIICYEVFKDQDAVFLSSCCQKCYHKNCILEWFKKTKNCPHCRAAIT